MSRFGAKIPLSSATTGTRGRGGSCGSGAREVAASGEKLLVHWRVTAPQRRAVMDLAAAAEPGAGSQHLEVRDEVAEKCQKLFLDFLEE